MVLSGSKVWTSGANETDYMIVLCRSEEKTEKASEGLSQIIIKMSSSGITVRPISSLTCEHHFNEVFFENVQATEEMFIGKRGNGWKQSMAELAFERSGPERNLSTYPLLEEAINILKKNSDDQTRRQIGNLIAKLIVLQRMSIGVSASIDQRYSPDIIASLVKDLGTQFENEAIDTVRSLISSILKESSENRYQMLLSEAILHAS